MTKYLSRLLAMTLVVAAASTALVAADDQPLPTTTIQVTDMHCSNCAQKIARKLYAVPAVVKVKTDVKTHTAVVVPEKKRQPNPLAMWKAVEAAGFQPVVLKGPWGEFKSKEALEERFGGDRTARRE